MPRARPANRAAGAADVSNRIWWTSVGPWQPSPIDDLKNWTLAWRHPPAH
jgi:hypothetical protein